MPAPATITNPITISNSILMVVAVAVRSIQTGLFILKGAAAAYFSVDRGRFVAKTQKGQTT